MNLHKISEFSPKRFLLLFQYNQILKFVMNFMKEITGIILNDTDSCINS